LINTIFSGSQDAGPNPYWGQSLNLSRSHYIIV